MSLNFLLLSCRIWKLNRFFWFFNLEGFLKVHKKEVKNLLILTTFIQSKERLHELFYQFIGIQKSTNILPSGCSLKFE